MSDNQQTLDEQHRNYCTRPACPRCARIRSQHDAQHDRWERRRRGDWK